MPNDYVSRTLRAYDNSPDKYFKSTAELVLKSELGWLAAHLNDRNGLVLDAGCAYGRDMAYLRSKNIRTVGIDMSKELLKLGKKLYPDMEFRKMDVRHLKFLAQTFCGIWCSAVPLHLTDKDIAIALKQFYRVLAAGGIVFVSFKLGSDSRVFVESFSSNQTRFYNFQTPESIEKLLMAAGFRLTKLNVINERRRFGTDKRDLDWIHAFAAKD